jgi:hypothetical protein
VIHDADRGGDLFAHDFTNLRIGRGAMEAGSDQDGDRVARDAGLLETPQQRWQSDAVRYGPRDVADGDRGGLPAAREGNERRAADRMVERMFDCAERIGERAGGSRFEDPVVETRREVQAQTLLAEGEIDQHSEAPFYSQAEAEAGFRRSLSCATLQFLKVKALTGWYWEVLCLLVYLAIAGNQLFVRPIIGQANNGDFPKVLGPRSICDLGKGEIEAYVHPRFFIDPKCLWDSELPSSESVFVGVNKAFANWTGRSSFSITGAGKAHLAVLLAALIILLWALHSAAPALRFGLPPLVILIFSDVAYVAYLNSFYMDAASMVFLLATVALAGAWVLRPRTWVAIGFGVAGVLMALSKTQHVITAFSLAGTAVWFAVRAFRQGKVRDGRWWAASGASVALAAVGIIALTPAGYKAEPLYSLVFFQLLPAVPDKVEALTELGLPASYAAYSGTHAYSSSAAIASLPWRIEFVGQIRYARLAAYYLRNPSVTLRFLGQALKDHVSGIRPMDLGNYLREDGFPPGTLARRFDTWTNVRAWLLLVFPAHIVIFYFVMGTGSLLCLSRQTWAARWPLYPLILMLSVTGITEFLFAVLLDGTETARHLFLFHVITEVLILCGAAAILSTLWPGPKTSSSVS